MPRTTLTGYTQRYDTILTKVIKGNTVYYDENSKAIINEIWKNKGKGQKVIKEILIQKGLIKLLNAPPTL